MPTVMPTVMTTVMTTLESARRKGRVKRASSICPISLLLPSFLSTHYRLIYIRMLRNTSLRLMMSQPLRFGLRGLRGTFSLLHPLSSSSSSSPLSASASVRCKSDTSVALPLSPLADQPVSCPPLVSAAGSSELDRTWPAERAAAEQSDGCAFKDEPGSYPLLLDRTWPLPAAEKEEKEEKEGAAAEQSDGYYVLEGRVLKDPASSLGRTWPLPAAENEKRAAAEQCDGYAFKGCGRASKDEHAGRRRALAERLPPRSLAVVSAAAPVIMSNDIPYRFRQASQRGLSPFSLCVYVYVCM